MKHLTTEDVIRIHDDVIEPGDLQGLAQNKSIDAVIGRIDNRIAYGLLTDVFDLAACYACYIAVGHAFNDANKRTAFVAMDICLALNGIDLRYDTVAAGNMIRQVSQNLVDETELARWLREVAVDV